MITSKYTFLFDINGVEFYAYNTLSNALIEVERDTFLTLQELKENDIDKINLNFDNELLQCLEKNGIITENDDDDFLKYKSSIVNMRSKCKFMHLTIAPTMDCCFRCHYCFEECKENTYMTSEVIDSIINYLRNQDEINEMKLTWFGGEPLMGLSQIEEFYEKLVLVWKKPIRSNIITTGYHIDEKVIGIFKKNNISFVQITLDGLKDTHNKVKFLPSGEDVFSKVWNNIILMNKIAPEIAISIRVNLTLENAHEYIKLLALYNKTFSNKKNMVIVPAFVIDRSKSDCDRCDKQNNLFGRIERSEFILNLAHNGIDSPYIRYPEHYFSECAIRNNVAISFDPEGFAYKCWEHVGNKKYAIGNLSSDGILTNINMKLLNRHLYGADALDDAVCIKCRYLPICNGGCPIQRIENKFDDGHNNTCTFHKGYLEEFMKLHIARKKSQVENQ